MNAAIRRPPSEFLPAAARSRLPENFPDWPEGMRQRYLRHALGETGKPGLSQNFSRSSS